MDRPPSPEKELSTEDIHDFNVKTYYGEHLPFVQDEFGVYSYSDSSTSPETFNGGVSNLSEDSLDNRLISSGLAEESEVPIIRSANVDNDNLCDVTNSNGFIDDILGNLGSNVNRASGVLSSETESELERDDESNSLSCGESRCSCEGHSSKDSCASPLALSDDSSFSSSCDSFDYPFLQTNTEHLDTKLTLSSPNDKFSISKLVIKFPPMSPRNYTFDEEKGKWKLKHFITVELGSVVLTAKELCQKRSNSKLFLKESPQDIVFPNTKLFSSPADIKLLDQNPLAAQQLCSNNDIHKVNSLCDPLPSNKSPSSLPHESSDYIPLIDLFNPKDGEFDPDFVATIEHISYRCSSSDKSNNTPYSASELSEDLKNLESVHYSLESNANNFTPTSVNNCLTPPMQNLLNAFDQRNNSENNVDNLNFPASPRLGNFNQGFNKISSPEPVKIKTNLQLSSVEPSSNIISVGEKVITCKNPGPFSESYSIKRYYDTCSPKDSSPNSVEEYKNLTEDSQDEGLSRHTPLASPDPVGFKDNTVKANCQNDINQVEQDILGVVSNLPRNETNDYRDEKSVQDFESDIIQDAALLYRLAKGVKAETFNNCKTPNRTIENVHFSNSLPLDMPSLSPEPVNTPSNIEKNSECISVVPPTLMPQTSLPELNKTLPLSEQPLVMSTGEPKTKVKDEKQRRKQNKEKINHMLPKQDIIKECAIAPPVLNTKDDIPASPESVNIDASDTKLVIESVKPKVNSFVTNNKNRCTMKTGKVPTKIAEDVKSGSLLQIAVSEKNTIVTLNELKKPEKKCQPVPKSFILGKVFPKNRVAKPDKNVTLDNVMTNGIEGKEEDHQVILKSYEDDSMAVSKSCIAHKQGQQIMKISDKNRIVVSMIGSKNNSTKSISLKNKETPCLVDNKTPLCKTPSICSRNHKLIVFKKNPSLLDKANKKEASEPSVPPNIPEDKRGNRYESDLSADKSALAPSTKPMNHISDDDPVKSEDLSQAFNITPTKNMITSTPLSNNIVLPKKNIHKVKRDESPNQMSTSNKETDIEKPLYMKNKTHLIRQRTESVVAEADSTGSDTSLLDKSHSEIFLKKGPNLIIQKDSAGNQLGVSNEIRLKQSDSVRLLLDPGNLSRENRLVITVATAEISCINKLDDSSNPAIPVKQTIGATTSDVYLSGQNDHIRVGMDFVRDTGQHSTDPQEKHPTKFKKETRSTDKIKNDKQTDKKSKASTSESINPSTLNSEEQSKFESPKSIKGSKSSDPETDESVNCNFSLPNTKEHDSKESDSVSSTSNGDSSTFKANSKNNQKIKQDKIIEGKDKKNNFLDNVINLRKRSASCGSTGKRIRRNSSENSRKGVCEILCRIELDSIRNQIRSKNLSLSDTCVSSICDKDSSKKLDLLSKALLKSGTSTSVNVEGSDHVEVSSSTSPGKDDKDERLDDLVMPSIDVSLISEKLDDEKKSSQKRGSSLKVPSAKSGDKKNNFSSETTKNGNNSSLSNNKNSSKENNLPASIEKNKGGLNGKASPKIKNTVEQSIDSPKPRKTSKKGNSGGLETSAKTIPEKTRSKSISDLKTAKDIKSPKEEKNNVPNQKQSEGNKAYLKRSSSETLGISNATEESSKSISLEKGNTSKAKDSTPKFSKLFLKEVIRDKNSKPEVQGKSTQLNGKKISPNSEADKKKAKENLKKMVNNNNLKKSKKDSKSSETLINDKRSSLRSCSSSSESARDDPKTLEKIQSLKDKTNISNKIIDHQASGKDSLRKSRKDSDNDKILEIKQLKSPRGGRSPRIDSGLDVHVVGNKSGKKSRPGKGDVERECKPDISLGRPSVVAEKKNDKTCLKGLSKSKELRSSAKDKKSVGEPKNTKVAASDYNDPFAFSSSPEMDDIKSYADYSGRKTNSKFGKNTLDNKDVPLKETSSTCENNDTTNSCKVNLRSTAKLIHDLTFEVPLTHFKTKAALKDFGNLPTESKPDPVGNPSAERNLKSKTESAIGKSDNLNVKTTNSKASWKKSKFKNDSSAKSYNASDNNELDDMPKKKKCNAESVLSSVPKVVEVTPKSKPTDLHKNKEKVEKKNEFIKKTGNLSPSNASCKDPGNGSNIERRSLRNHRNSVGDNKTADETTNASGEKMSVKPSVEAKTVLVTDKSSEDNNVDKAALKKVSSPSSTGEILKDNLSTKVSNRSSISSKSCTVSISGLSSSLTGLNKIASVSTEDLFKDKKYSKASKVASNSTHRSKSSPPSSDKKSDRYSSRASKSGSVVKSSETINPTVTDRKLRSSANWTLNDSLCVLNSSKNENIDVSNSESKNVSIQSDSASNIRTVSRRSKSISESSDLTVADGVENATSKLSLQHDDNNKTRLPSKNQNKSDPCESKNDNLSASQSFSQNVGTNLSDIPLPMSPPLSRRSSLRFNKSESDSSANLIDISKIDVSEIPLPKSPPPCRKSPRYVGKASSPYIEREQPTSPIVGSPKERKIAYKNIMEDNDSRSESGTNWRITAKDINFIADTHKIDLGLKSPEKDVQRSSHPIDSNVLAVKSPGNAAAEDHIKEHFKSQVTPFDLKESQKIAAPQSESVPCERRSLRLQEKMHLSFQPSSAATSSSIKNNVGKTEQVSHDNLKPCQQQEPTQTALSPKMSSLSSGHKDTLSEPRGIDLLEIKHSAINSSNFKGETKTTVQNVELNQSCSLVTDSESPRNQIILDKKTSEAVVRLENSSQVQDSVSKSEGELEFSNPQNSRRRFQRSRNISQSEGKLSSVTTVQSNLEEPKSATASPLNSDLGSQVDIHLKEEEISIKNSDGDPSTSSGLDNSEREKDENTINLKDSSVKINRKKDLTSCAAREMKHLKNVESKVAKLNSPLASSDENQSSLSDGPLLSKSLSSTSDQSNTSNTMENIATNVEHVLSESDAGSEIIEKITSNNNIIEPKTILTGKVRKNSNLISQKVGKLNYKSTRHRIVSLPRKNKSRSKRPRQPQTSPQVSSTEIHDGAKLSTEVLSSLSTAPIEGVLAPQTIDNGNKSLEKENILHDFITPSADEKLTSGDISNTANNPEELVSSENNEADNNDIVEFNGNAKNDFSPNPVNSIVSSDHQKLTKTDLSEADVVNNETSMSSADKGSKDNMALKSPLEGSSNVSVSTPTIDSLNLNMSEPEHSTPDVTKCISAQDNLSYDQISRSPVSPGLKKSESSDEREQVICDEVLSYPRNTSLLISADKENLEGTAGSSVTFDMVIPSQPLNSHVQDISEIASSPQYEAIIANTSDYALVSPVSDTVVALNDSSSFHMKELSPGSEYIELKSSSSIDMPSDSLNPNQIALSHPNQIRNFEVESEGIIPFASVSTLHPYDDKIISSNMPVENLKESCDEKLLKRIEEHDGCITSNQVLNVCSYENLESGSIISLPESETMNFLPRVEEKSYISFEKSDDTINLPESHNNKSKEESSCSDSIVNLNQSNGSLSDLGLNTMSEEKMQTQFISEKVNVEKTESSRNLILGSTLLLLGSSEDEIISSIDVSNPVSDLTAPLSCNNDDRRDSDQGMFGSLYASDENISDLRANPVPLDKDLFESCNRNFISDSLQQTEQNDIPTSESYSLSSDNIISTALTPEKSILEAQRENTSQNVAPIFSSEDKIIVNSIDAPTLNSEYFLVTPLDETTRINQDAQSNLDLNASENAVGNNDTNIPKSILNTSVENVENTTECISFGDNSSGHSYQDKPDDKALSHQMNQADSEHFTLSTNFELMSPTPSHASKEGSRELCLDTSTDDVDKYVEENNVIETSQLVLPVQHDEPVVTNDVMVERDDINPSEQRDISTIKSSTIDMEKPAVKSLNVEVRNELSYSIGSEGSEELKTKETSLPNDLDLHPESANPKILNPSGESYILKNALSVVDNPSFSADLMSNISDRENNDVNLGELPSEVLYHKEDSKLPSLNPHEIICPSEELEKEKLAMSTDMDGEKDPICESETSTSLVESAETSLSLSAVSLVNSKPVAREVNLESDNNYLKHSIKSEELPMAVKENFDELLKESLPDSTKQVMPTKEKVNLKPCKVSEDSNKVQDAGNLNNEDEISMDKKPIAEILVSEKPTIDNNSDVEPSVKNVESSSSGIPDHSSSEIPPPSSTDLSSNVDSCSISVREVLKCSASPYSEENQNDESTPSTISRVDASIDRTENDSLPLSEFSKSVTDIPCESTTGQGDIRRESCTDREGSTSVANSINRTVSIDSNTILDSEDLIDFAEIPTDLVVVDAVSDDSGSNHSVTVTPSENNKNYNLKLPPSEFKLSCSLVGKIDSVNQAVGGLVEEVTPSSDSVEGASVSKSSDRTLEDTVLPPCLLNKDLNVDETSDLKLPSPQATPPTQSSLKLLASDSHINFTADSIDEMCKLTVESNTNVGGENASELSNNDLELKNIISSEDTHNEGDVAVMKPQSEEVKDYLNIERGECLEVEKLKEVKESPSDFSGGMKIQPNLISVTEASDQNQSSEQLQSIPFSGQELQEVLSCTNEETKQNEEDKIKENENLSLSDELGKTDMDNPRSNIGEESEQISSNISSDQGGSEEFERNHSSDEVNRVAEPNQNASTEVNIETIQSQGVESIDGEDQQRDIIGVDVSTCVNESLMSSLLHNKGITNLELDSEQRGQDVPPSPEAISIQIKDVSKDLSESKLDDLKVDKEFRNQSDEIEVCHTPSSPKYKTILGYDSVTNNIIDTGSPDILSSPSEKLPISPLTVYNASDDSDSSPSPKMVNRSLSKLVDSPSSVDINSCTEPSVVPSKTVVEDHLDITIVNPEENTVANFVSNLVTKSPIDVVVVSPSGGVVSSQNDPGKNYYSLSSDNVLSELYDSKKLCTKLSSQAGLHSSSIQEKFEKQKCPNNSGQTSTEEEVLNTLMSSMVRSQEVENWLTEGSESENSPRTSEYSPDNRWDSNSQLSPHSLEIANYRKRKIKAIRETEFVKKCKLNYKSGNIIIHSSEDECGQEKDAKHTISPSGLSKLPLNVSKHSQKSSSKLPNPYSKVFYHNRNKKENNIIQSNFSFKSLFSHRKSSGKTSNSSSLNTDLAEDSSKTSVDKAEKEIEDHSVNVEKEEFDKTDHLTEDINQIVDIKESSAASSLPCAQSLEINSVASKRLSLREKVLSSTRVSRNLTRTSSCQSFFIQSPDEVTPMRRTKSCDCKLFTESFGLDLVSNKVHNQNNTCKISSAELPQVSVKADKEKSSHNDSKEGVSCPNDIDLIPMKQVQVLLERIDVSKYLARDDRCLTPETITDSGKSRRQVGRRRLAKRRKPPSHNQVEFVCSNNEENIDQSDSKSVTLQTCSDAINSQPLLKELPDHVTESNGTDRSSNEHPSIKNRIDARDENSNSSFDHIHPQNSKHSSGKLTDSVPPSSSRPASPCSKDANIKKDCQVVLERLNMQNLQRIMESNGVHTVQVPAYFLHLKDSSTRLKNLNPSEDHYVRIVNDPPFLKVISVKNSLEIFQTDSCELRHCHLNIDNCRCHLSRKLTSFRGWEQMKHEVDKEQSKVTSKPGRPHSLTTVSNKIKKIVKSKMKPKTKTKLIKKFVSDSLRPVSQSNSDNEDNSLFESREWPALATDSKTKVPETAPVGKVRSMEMIPDEKALSHVYNQPARTTMQPNANTEPTSSSIFPPDLNPISRRSNLIDIYSVKGMIKQRKEQLPANKGYDSFNLNTFYEEGEFNFRDSEHVVGETFAGNRQDGLIRSDLLSEELSRCPLFNYDYLMTKPDEVDKATDFTQDQLVNNYNNMMAVNMDKEKAVLTEIEKTIETNKRKSDMNESAAKKKKISEDESSTSSASENTNDGVNSSVSNEKPRKLRVKDMSFLMPSETTSSHPAVSSLGDDSAAHQGWVSRPERQPKKVSKRREWYLKEQMRRQGKSSHFRYFSLSKMMGVGLNQNPPHIDIHRTFNINIVQMVGETENRLLFLTKEGAMEQPLRVFDSRTSKPSGRTKIDKKSPDERNNILKSLSRLHQQHPLFISSALPSNHKTDQESSKEKTEIGEPPPVENAEISENTSHNMRSGWKHIYCRDEVFDTNTVENDSPESSTMREGEDTAIPYSPLSSSQDI